MDLFRKDLLHASAVPLVTMVVFFSPRRLPCRMKGTFGWRTRIFRMSRRAVQVIAHCVFSYICGHTYTTCTSMLLLEQVCLAALMRA
jgi:hypothetical protein